MRLAKKSLCAFVLLIIYIFSLSGYGSYPVSDGALECVALSCGSESKIEISSRILKTLFSSGENGKKESEMLFLIPSGDAFGIKINEERPSVSAILKNTPLAVGDKILEIDGVSIYSVKDAVGVVSDCGGKSLTVRILRGEKEEIFTLTPYLVDGKYTLGVEMRQSSVGIGTITYINPETHEFGGLGHGVCDAHGALVRGKTAIATSAVLTGVKRGESGKPGELCGTLGRGVLGEINLNCECGVFGTICASDVEGEAIPVGKREELRVGKAEIISTLKNGKKARYEIEICEIDHSSTGSKSFKIKVTDEALIAISGGIVRGMSGSPIIQDGKLVGAVTHVLVANPTEGYGIFIENMLSAASAGALPKAA